MVVQHVVLAVLACGLPTVSAVLYSHWAPAPAAGSQFQRRLLDVEASYGEGRFWDMGFDVCGTCVSEQDQADIMAINREQKWSAGIYGEVTPDGAVTLLQQLGAQPGQVFFDLGSGVGKIVAIAAHVFGMRATGVELSRDRHGEACGALAKLKSQSPVANNANGFARFVRGSFFDYDVGAADFIFIDSVEFTEDMMRRLGDVIHAVRPGARVVMTIPPHVPDPPDFQYLGIVTTKCTWGNHTYEMFEKTPLIEGVAPTAGRSGETPLVDVAHASETCAAEHV